MPFVVMSNFDELSVFVPIPVTFSFVMSFVSSISLMMPCSLLEGVDVVNDQPLETAVLFDLAFSPSVPKMSNWY